MDLIYIRRLVPGDEEIIDFTLDRLAGVWNYPRDEVRRLCLDDAFGEGLPHVYIAKTNDGDFVGEAIAAIDPEGYLGIEDQPWLLGLFVDEKFRGQGVGARLIEYVAGSARDAAFPHLYLDTADAAGYYRKLGGWEELGVAWYEQTRENVVIMRKCLG